MARQLRIEYEGAFYHVTSRGNQRGKIFWDDKDRERLKTILERTKERYGYLLHGYVFMSNHYHLLIETPRANIKQVMQNINTSYTVFVNRKYHRSGHLFQGRYKAFIVDKERYLLELGRYIHLNPVRVGVARRPEDFRWSSYRDYIGSRNDGLVDTEDTLGLFSKKRDIAIRRYREFVNEGVHGRSPFGNAMGSILGDEGFRERVVKYLRVLPDKGAIPEIRKIRKRQGLDEIVRGVAKYYGLLEVDLLRRRRRTEGQRKMAVYLSKVLSGEKNVEIGSMFGITIQAVTNAVRSVEKRIAEDSKFGSEIMRLKEIVSIIK
ncbi:MAG: transposase [Thermodesulfobacteriota bacterium]